MLTFGLGDHFWSSFWFSNKQHYLSGLTTSNVCCLSKLPCLPIVITVKDVSAQEKVRNSFCLIIAFKTSTSSLMPLVFAQCFSTWFSINARHTVCRACTTLHDTVSYFNINSCIHCRNIWHWYIWVFLVNTVRNAVIAWNLLSREGAAENLSTWHRIWALFSFAC